MEHFDVVIVGAGMAGASLAWTLAPQRRVLLLEQESQPGYHSTGRSAATLHSSYGNAAIRALTAASAPFYRDPPAGLRRGHPCPPARHPDGRRAEQLDAGCARSRTRPLRARASSASMRERCLALRAGAAAPTMSAAGDVDPTMLDLDVAAILAGFLRGARAHGAMLRSRAGADRRPSR